MRDLYTGNRHSQSVGARVTKYGRSRFLMLMRLISLLLLVAATSAWSKPLSLTEAIDRALKDSPSLAAERERERIVDLEMRNRSNAFYPRLDLESSHGVGQTNVSQTTDPWISSTQLKVTEKLYDNGVSWTKYKQGKEDREVARLSYEKARDQVILQTTERFYAFSKANLVLEAIKTQKDLIDKQYDSVEKKFRQGLRTKRDYLRFKAQAQKMQLDARAAVNAKEKVLLDLKKLIGVSPSSPDYSETDFIIAKPESVKVEFDSSNPKTAGTFEYRIAEGSAEAKRYDADLAARKNWPEFNLVSGAYIRNDSYIGSSRPFRDTEGYGWNVMLQMQYNFWDWGERRREKEKAEASLLIFDHEMRKTENEVSAEIQQLMNDMKDAKLNLSVSEELLKAQTEAHEVIRRDYSEGRAEYQDLMIALTDLLEAKGRYYQARFDLGSLIAKRQYFEGNLYANYKK